MKKKLTSVPVTKDNVHALEMAKNKTLKELLQDQLDNMSEEDGNLEVFDALLIIDTDVGLASINMTPTSIYRCLGMLEVIKTHVMDGLYED